MRRSRGRSITLSAGNAPLDNAAPLIRAAYRPAASAASVRSRFQFGALRDAERGRDNGQRWLFVLLGVIRDVREDPAEPPPVPITPPSLAESRVIFYVAALFSNVPNRLYLPVAIHRLS